MNHAKVRIVSLATAVIAVSVVAAAIWFNIASSQVSAPVDWINQTPVVTKATDLSSSPTISNRDCTMMNVQVTRGFSTPSEQHCMVPTAMGLMSEQGDIVQPNSYNKAYPLVNLYGGNPSTRPIPNQPAALSLTGSGLNNGTSHLALYRSLHSHLKFDTSPYPRMRVDQPTSEYFRYDDGTAMKFIFNTMTYPQNGRYFIIDTARNGFMKVDMLNLNKRPIATSLPFLFNGMASNSANAIDNNGRFAVIAYNTPGEPTGAKYVKIIDTNSCTGGFNAVSTVLPVFSCPTVNVRPALAQAIPNLRDVFNVRFINERTISFVASSGVIGATPTYAKYTMVAGGQTARLVDYLAVGDSYISGEGAYNYRDGTATERNTCHQSLSSYPYLLSQSASSFASVACSGAKMHNVKPPAVGENKESQLKDDIAPSQPEKDEALINHQPGVIFQNTFVFNDNPAAVTISIGGNDIGFGDILKKCVHPFQNLRENLLTHHTCYPTYEDRLEVVNTINGKMPKLRELYKDMRNGGTETRRVYVVGYPQVAKIGGNCALNVAMNAEEIKFSHDLIAYLNNVIKRAADEAGVQYVDTQASFDGHRLCEGESRLSAMNGFTVEKNRFGKFEVTASFHPNRAGHQMLAATVAAQTQNLTKAMPEPVAETVGVAVDPNAPILQNVPVTQRPVRHVQMMESKETVVEKGSPLDMVVNGREYYTKPNGVYNVVMQSTPVSLGNFTANAEGNLTIAPVIPVNAEPGFHTIHVYGSDMFNNQIDLQRVIYVAASAEDYDGDGVPNATDNCGLVAQSGIDIDVDDIDDACDPLIAAAPVSPPDPEGIIWRDDAVLSLEIQIVSNSGQ